MNLYSIKEITDKTQWHNLLLKFEDANLYQLWNYGKIVQHDNVSHLALYDKNELIAVVQVRFKLVPLIKRGIAYIFAGPVWHKKNTAINTDILKSIYFTLYNELCNKSRLSLRINPNVFENDKYYNDLSIEGFSRKKLPYNHRTIFLDLERELDDIRMGFKQRFRKTINRAERNGIEIIIGFDPALFNDFIELYNKLIDRKKFKTTVSPIPFIEFNNQLDSELKAVVFVAKVNGQPVSALIGSAIGTTGLALFSATNEIGMKVGASNLLHWERIKWFKKTGCKKYDLGGVNPDTNKSVYEFKLGISQEEYAHIGVFEASEDKLSKTIISIGEYFRNISSKK